MHQQDQGHKQDGGHEQDRGHEQGWAPIRADRDLAQCRRAARASKARILRPGALCASSLRQCGFAAAIALGAITPVRAQPALGPQLQDADITGQGSRLTIRRLPVRTPGGIVYRDITIDLKLDASGGVRAAAQGNAARPAGAAPATAAPSAVARDVTVSRMTETETPPEVATPFTPGLYRDDQHGGTVRVADAGRRLFSGFPTWTLAAEGSDTAIGQAEWYGGPLRSNPSRAMVARARITDEEYSFGVVDSQGSGHFDQGMLIGAKQQGDKLIIVSFHSRGCCTYANTPTSMVTYTRVVS